MISAVITLLYSSTRQQIDFYKSGTAGEISKLYLNTCKDIDALAGHFAKKERKYKEMLAGKAVSASEVAREFEEAKVEMIDISKLAEKFDIEMKEITNRSSRRQWRKLWGIK